jgi:hypothetical protein
MIQWSVCIVQNLSIHPSEDVEKTVEQVEFRGGDN